MGAAPRTRDTDEQKMVEAAIGFGKAFDQRRSEPSGKPYLEAVLIVSSVHVAVAHENHGDFVLLEKRESRVRVLDGALPVLVHGMRGDGVFRQSLVHPDEDDLFRSASGIRVSSLPLHPSAPAAFSLPPA